MNTFTLRDRQLCCEDVPLADLAAEYGTPLWVYSRARLLHEFRSIREAFAAVDPVICYSVKANGNLSLLRLLGEAGCSFDVVSGGNCTGCSRPVAKPPGSALPVSGRPTRRFALRSPRTF